ncbi:MAG TPA: hypothetical protein VGC69_04640 [Bordetella sp.]
MAGASARAAVCDAAFMHEGGVAQFVGQGPLTLSADLAFSEVAQQGAGQCRARVQGSASFVYMGIPTGQTRLDYLMTVKGGQASFVRYDKAGEAPSHNGQFDLRMLGLFAYDQVREGQHLPGAAYHLNIGSDSPVGSQPGTTVRIGPKTVGARQTLSTPKGSQACWPITYSRATDPTTLSLNGLVLPIPGVTSTVTDWYCPQLNLVVRQDIAQAEAKSSVVLTQLR